MLWILLANPSSPCRSAVRADRIEYKHMPAGGGKARARGEKGALVCADSSEHHSVVAVGALPGHITQVASPRSMTLDADRRRARCVICRHDLRHHLMRREPSAMGQPRSQEIGKADSWIEDFHLEAVGRTWHTKEARPPSANGQKSGSAERRYSASFRRQWQPLPSDVTAQARGRSESALDLMLHAPKRFPQL